jgi:hypothetical protein
VALLAGFSATNLSVQPNKWKRNREIFAIQHGPGGLPALLCADSGSSSAQGNGGNPEDL